MVDKERLLNVQDRQMDGGVDIQTICDVQYVYDTQMSRKDYFNKDLDYRMLNCF